MKWIVLLKDEDGDPYNNWFDNEADAEPPQVAVDTLEGKRNG